LHRHASDPEEGDRVADIQQSISNAAAFSRDQIHELGQQISDITLPIGMELWFPTMLDLLEKEGMLLDFEGRAWLLNLRLKKLSKLPLETLYGPD
jgi:hypothetical protein